MGKSRHRQHLTPASLERAGAGQLVSKEPQLQESCLLTCRGCMEEEWVPSTFCFFFWEKEVLRASQRSVSEHRGDHKESKKTINVSWEKHKS